TLACGSSPGGDNTTGAGGTIGPSCLATTSDCTSAPNNCCSGICLAKVGDPAHHDFCADPCTVDSQCASGCCAMLTHTTQRACSSRGFCPETCMQSGTACTSNDDCCAGNLCVTPSNTCAAVCTSGAQCVSGCCALLSDGITAVCSNPIYCQ